MTTFRKRLGLATFVLLLAALAGCKSDDNHPVATDSGTPPDSGKPAQCTPLPALPLPKAGSCGADELLYDDRSCQGIVRNTDGGGLDADGGAADECELVGDGRCHSMCNTDADCTDPCRPHCRTLGLYASGDYGCNREVKVCSDSDQDRCHP